MLFTCNVLASSPKADIIRQKLAEISAVREKMAEKEAQATKMRRKLKEQLKEFKEEIKNEQKRLGIATYEGAIRFPRINYNLRLIQQLLAYISKLDEQIVYYQTSNGNLEFLVQQADDDLRIVETLNDMKVEDLANQIDQVLRRHIPGANKLLIDTEGMVFSAPEKIWNEVIEGKKGPHHNLIK
jgi:uncharacterized phage infection (PIP) family protein YhgE